eukprot:Skav201304  [mRNA]  locus=scaffold1490:4225:14519:- [translate_table: standard]
MEHPVFEGRPGKLPHWASNLEENAPCRQEASNHSARRPKTDWLAEDQPQEKVYADIYLGTMLIRGENVCLFGEVDPDRQDGKLIAPRQSSAEKRRRRHFALAEMHAALDVIEGPPWESFGAQAAQVEPR